MIPIPSPGARKLGECVSQVGREVDERAGSAGIEHHLALRGEAGIDQGQRHSQRSQNSTVVPVSERTQDDREPIRHDRQLQAAIGRYGLLQLPDETVKQLVNCVVIRTDARGEIAQAGQETLWNLQRDAPRKRIRPLIVSRRCWGSKPLCQ